MALFASMSYGFFYTYSVFFDPWIAEFGWNREQIASVFSLYLIISGISTMVLGKLTDRYGPRKVVLLGAILFALGTGLSSQADSLGELRIFYGMIASAGTGAFWVPPVYSLQRWFVRRRGLVMGIAASGVGLGTLVFAPLATYLIGLIGWRDTLLAFAIGFGILLLIAAGFMRADPSDKGLKPYGYQAETELQTDNPAGQLRGLTAGQALKTRPFWQLYAGYGVCFMSVYLILVHIMPYAEDIGVARMAAAGAISILGGCSIGGRIAMGAVSDIIGRKWGLVICYALITIAMLGFSMTRELWLLYLSAGLLGFSYGGVVSQYAAIFGEYFGLAYLGTIYAIAITGFAFGGSIGPYIGGAMFVQSGSYNLAFLICIGLGIMALIATIFLKPPQKSTKVGAPLE